MATKQIIYYTWSNPRDNFWKCYSCLMPLHILEIICAYSCWIHMYFCLIRRPYSLLRSFRLVLALASQANSCSPTSLLLHPLEGLATYTCLTHVVLYYAYIHACFRCTEQSIIYIFIYISLSLYLDIGLYTAKKWYADIHIYNTYANLCL